jgi:carbonic anhydrase
VARCAQAGLKRGVAAADSRGMRRCFATPVSAWLLAGFIAPAWGGVAVAPAAAASAAAKGAPDTIEQLSERLNERLGANAQLAADGSLLLKVTPHGKAASGPRRGAGASAAPHHVRRPPLPAPGAWTYADGPAGPAAWATLSPAFAACGHVGRQSPIDLRDPIRVQLDPIGFDYRASSFSVLDTGRTIEVQPGAGNAIHVLGRGYALRQLQFRHPSETAIDGHRFPLEAQLLHEDEGGRLAVVSVLFDSGAAQPALQTVWNSLPLQPGEPQPAQVTLDPSALLPTDRRHAEFIGSLTAPPCTEGVLWLVMTQPVPVSPQQLAIFERLYPMNARPLQPAAGRLIKASE